MKPRMILTTAAFLALVVCLPASGEVSAKLDENGNYVGMVYRMGPLARIWASPAPTFNRRPLNATGDTLGDLAPAVAAGSTLVRVGTALFGTRPPNP